MTNKQLQVENGNFTRIINPVLDTLIQIPFKGSELEVALFVIRKTWGYNKKEDRISLTQIEQGVQRGRPTVVKALKNLERLNIVVKTGSPHRTNKLSINKYIDTWRVVKTGSLVKGSADTSKYGLTSTSKDGLTETSKDGLTHKRQKTSIKTKTKDIYTPSFEKFYEMYPKKVGKKQAFGEWQRLSKELHEKIYEDIPKRMKDEKWVEGYVKDPIRYLKHRQWEDEITISNNIVKTYG